MSRRHPYPVASTSYHAPHTHKQVGVQGIRQRAPSSPEDIYIPRSQEERNRVGIESRLLREGGPRYREADPTSASSTMDTYDRIGLVDDHLPIGNTHDESMIPGVGRGMRNEQPRQASHYDQLRSLKQYSSHMTASSPVRSPYRPGKYRNGYAASSSIRRAYPAPPGATLDLDAVAAGLRSRHARVETESESDHDSVTDSADSDGNNNEIASVQSTGNHRGFAATPAGHTLTMTGNIRQRPPLGVDTLNRIDFDHNTDTDSDRKTRAQRRPRSNSDDPTYTNIQLGPRPDQKQQNGARPFASTRSSNTNGINAIDYQQHLASRTMTSPALRTMIGDRSKSPDSPTPLTSTDNIKLPSHHSGRGVRESASVSAFEDLARRLQRDVELTRRGTGNDDDGSNSNSGGSGFGPGSQASSARTKVDQPPLAQFNKHGYPVYPKPGTMASPFAARLPDVTGLTSALGSPIKPRVQHLTFDPAVGNQEARLEELANLRYFVDGIQVELDRAGERILALEETQDLQSQEVQGLRTDMQNVIRDVRKKQHASDDQLVDIVMQRLAKQKSTDSQLDPPPHKAAVSPEPTPYRTRQDFAGPRQNEAVLPEMNGAPLEKHVNVEAVNKLYAELDQLRLAMEEQYKSAASAHAHGQDEQRPSHYSQHGCRSKMNDQWEAIEALRVQVLQLARQVEGLSTLVVDKVWPAQQTRAAKAHFASSTHLRQQYMHDQHRPSRFEGHAASDPVMPYRETAHARSSSPPPILRGRKVPHGQYDRNFTLNRPQSTGGRAYASVEDYPELEAETEYDKTIDAVAENKHSQRDRHSHRPADEQDEREISRIAHARAEQASARISQREPHSATTCSVCAARIKSDRRKAARKSKMLKAEQRREAVELEETILLNTLDPNEDNGAAFDVSLAATRIGRAGIKTLHRILAEHWDEFLHQRMLYAELADELKSLSPDMSKTKRKILAQHLLEAVELLELKADRINRLDKVLAACASSNHLDDPSAEKIRKEAGDVRTQANKR